ncbi:hypothetical protein V1290_002823 [Bradyrhizobium sp. AZCC 1578]|uniref:hypothetical protein n=1 Tax=Bradyrhizobium sp. AZCC 1578 TaxID=3117027 RepID=UPI002FF352BD
MSLTDEEDLSAISAHGKTLETPAVPKEIEERLDALELAIEQAGRSAALVVKVDHYVSDLQADLRALRTTRFFLVLLTLLFVGAVNGTVFYLLFHHGAWFWLQDVYFKTALVVGSLTSSVVLLSIMLKGAFHSLSERTKDDSVPPNLKEIFDAIKTLTDAK